jgi:hypothetical protein
MEIAEHGIDLYDCDNGARVIRSAANIIEVRK